MEGREGGRKKRMKEGWKRNIAVNIIRYKAADKVIRSSDKDGNKCNAQVNASQTIPNQIKLN